MSFDKSTRNLLAKIVAACRERLASDIADQLQSAYGLYPDGTQLDVARTESQRRAADDLRALLAHYAANLPQGKDRPQAAYQRLVREAGFTLLNRLAALRLCEERGLVIECVRKGMESDGFRLYDMLAGGALGNRYQTYRAFLERMFDELARDLGALFDRGNPLSHLFPSEAALTEVLALLNNEELASCELWTQDETIGWIYQYYNDPAERKQMRQESQVPRNSRELAVRNQFFTPRYVVEFLTDNTLGRLWVEMRGGDSRLQEICQYLVVASGEDNGHSAGEDSPRLTADRPSVGGRSASDSAGASSHSIGGDAAEAGKEFRSTSTFTQSERPKKDPRNLKILDPACGSGHFLLYVFNLLLIIYEEAWSDPDLPPFSETGTWLAHDYPSLEELRRAAPELILRHNLHGVDIDPRAAQIASLALWLRAQRAWQEMETPPAERPQVRKTNVVVAEPMPGDARLLEEFIEGLDDVPFVGQLVRVVFDKMHLAGEAGSLLKVEEDLREAIAAAKQQWLACPKPEQLGLWAEPKRPRPEQMRFDLSGITDEQFWQEAEGRVLDALGAYARQTENGQGARRRLFADEASMGFAFVDLCREKFDVVLMNPPFGGSSKEVQNYLDAAYPLTKNDLYALFTERCLGILNSNGRLGTITSRTGFFVSSFQNWREEILLKNAPPEIVADLGEGILDAAIVETAAYILAKSIPNSGIQSIFIRLLYDEQKAESLVSTIQAVNSGEQPSNVFFTNPETFRLIPGSPFAYWTSNSVRKLFKNFASLESEERSVRLGLSTKNDARFVRVHWEISPGLIGRQAKWSRYANGSSTSPFFWDYVTLVLSENDFQQLREYIAFKFPYLNRNSGWILHDENDYVNPFIGWPLRSLRYSPQAVPPGYIFSARTYALLLSNPDDYLFSLAVLSSTMVHYLLSLKLGVSGRPEYVTGTVRVLPFPNVPTQVKEQLANIVSSLFSLQQNKFSQQEISNLFSYPRFLDGNGKTLLSLFSEWKSISIANNEKIISGKNDIDAIIYELYGINDKEQESVEKFGNIASENADDESEHDNLMGVQDFISEFFSYMVGIGMGRWDIRLKSSQNLLKELPAPFTDISNCSPGILLGVDGFPATSGNIVSEVWLKARPDTITLPEMSTRGNEKVVVLDGKEYPATIPDGENPLPIPWDGVLVDDPGLDGKSPHLEDLVERIRLVLRLLWLESHAEIEAEACEILGVKELRDYFRKSSAFFADHLKRYSKSRRQAPIYWPLSTASGDYTLWLYYPRLSAETLPTALNRFVDPKIASVERHVSALEKRLSEISGRAATDLRDDLDRQKAFLSELRDFRAELMRISALPYQPDLNDGVIINAAPFHRLFRLSKWSKDTESVWKKLQVGEYDWSHMAYVLWPERVRKVCKTDKSIAIAHGLESLYVEVERKKGKKKVEGQEEMDEFDL